MKTIFVSIASYKDPELLPTILDLNARADHPERVQIGVAWQHDKDEIIEFPGNVVYLDIPAEDSNGACWARASIQQHLYADEDYYMQIDSHHRFAKGWDTICIDMLDRCESDKPVLSTYVPAFNPRDYTYEDIENAPLWGQCALGYDNGAVLTFVPIKITDPKLYRNRYMAGGFIFSHGQYIKDVPYDPGLYFIGEELTLALRTYTHGYDVFVPDKVITVHEYTRKQSIKHWDDDAHWDKKDRHSKNRIKALFDGKLDDPLYGVGNVRTIAEYEKYAGIQYKDKVIHPDAKKIPYFTDLDDWSVSIKKYYLEYKVYPEQFYQGLDPKEIKFCHMGIRGNNNEIIERVDIKPAKIRQILETGIYIREIDAFEPPCDLVLYPYSIKNEWLMSHDISPTVCDVIVGDE